MKDDLQYVPLPDPNELVGRYMIVPSPCLSCEIKIEPQIHYWEGNPRQLFGMKPVSKFFTYTWKVTGWRKMGYTRWFKIKDSK